MTVKCTAAAGSRFPAFLTTEEVLDYLKVNPRTIYRLIRTGELPAVRIGRLWRFKRTDVDDWLERQRAVLA
jgi:excisionase family DNA binding protein